MEVIAMDDKGCFGCGCGCFSILIILGILLVIGLCALLGLVFSDYSTEFGSLIQGVSQALSYIA
jgi:flagellar basal body-associated protein FliL